MYAKIKTPKGTMKVPYMKKRFLILLQTLLN